MSLTWSCITAVIDEEITQGVAWNEKALQTVEELCTIGLDVAVAGGINADIIPMLWDASLYAVVVGRGITSKMIRHMLLERSLKKSAKLGRINDLTMSNYTLEHACVRNYDLMDFKLIIRQIQG